MTSSEIPVPLPEDAHEIPDGVTRATAAQLDWARRSLAERLSLISSWRDVLVRRHHELADAVVRELGKPLSLSRDEVTRAISHIDAALTVFTPSSSSRSALTSTSRSLVSRSARLHW